MEYKQSSKATSTSLNSIIALSIESSKSLNFSIFNDTNVEACFLAKLKFSYIPLASVSPLIR